MSAPLDTVTEIVRDVFGDDDIVLSETTTADDIDGWDSLMHLNVVIAVEKRFSIRFTTAEISQLKEPGQNIGSLVALIGVKTGHAP